MKYVEILSEDDIVLLQCQSIILAESNSHQLYEVKLIKKIKDVLSKVYKGSISKLKEILSQAKVKISSFIRFVAKNIKKIKNIRIINVEQTKDYFSDVVKRILEKPEFKNESKKLSLASILFEGDTQIERVIDYIPPEVKEPLQSIKADKDKLEKFQKDIKKAAKEDKKFNFANNLMRTIKNYEKPVKFLLAITMVATFASSAISFGGTTSTGDDTASKVPGVAFVHEGTGEIAIQNVDPFKIADNLGQDFDFSGNADAQDQESIKINLGDYEYLSAQSETEFLKFILTKAPTQFKNKKHVDKVLKKAMEASENRVEIHKIDDIQYVMTLGSCSNRQTMFDFIMNNATFKDDITEKEKIKEANRLSKKMIDQFENDGAFAFASSDQELEGKEIIFVDLDVIKKNFGKDNKIKDTEEVFKFLKFTIEHELGHVHSKLKVRGIDLLDSVLEQNVEVDFYGFAGQVLDKAFTLNRKGYNSFYVSKMQLDLYEKYGGKEGTGYKMALDKQGKYKENFIKLLSKLDKENRKKIKDFIFENIKIGLASNCIEVTYKGKPISSQLLKNVDFGSKDLKIKPVDKEIFYTASNLLNDSQGSGYFFHEEERSENLNNNLKAVYKTKLKSFAEKLVNSDFIENKIKNKEGITEKEFRNFFSELEEEVKKDSNQKESLFSEEFQFWRLMSIAGFGDPKDSGVYMPMSSLGEDYESLHQNFWKVSKAMIRVNSKAIAKNRKGHDHDHHDHDHKHESFARLKEKVYNRILSETYNIYT